jgi:hypothetical protein
VENLKLEIHTGSPVNSGFQVFLIRPCLELFAEACQQLL